LNGVSFSTYNVFLRAHYTGGCKSLRESGLMLHFREKKRAMVLGNGTPTRDSLLSQRNQWRNITFLSSGVYTSSNKHNYVSGFSADYIQQFVPSMMLPQPLHLMIGMIVPLCLDLAFAEKSTLLSGQRLHV